MGWWLQLIGMILALIGFLISPQENVIKSGGKFIINLFSNNNIQTHSGVGDNVAGNKVVYENSLYSSMQTITLAPEEFGGNDSLNIDNIGKLIVITSKSNEDKIVVWFNVSPIRGIIKENGIVGEYKILEGGYKSREFTFDRINNSKLTLEGNGRSFLITLTDVERIDIKDFKKTLRYKFSISEKPVN